MLIEIDKLQKNYGSVQAVRSLSLTVADGTLFAFLGANGAGKSTTISCLSTTLAPTAGTIRVSGYDAVREANQVRRKIGVVFQASLLDPLLSVRENLSLRAGFYGISRQQITQRVSELAKTVGISDILERRYGRLSGGLRRRADIARAILHKPEVLFLDEPTAGLDSVSREQIWATIADLRAETQMSVFLTTHYLEETERADQVCIIDQGQIVAEGTPGELRAKYSSSVLTLRHGNLDALIQSVQNLGISYESVGGAVQISVSSGREAKNLLNQLGIDDFEFRHGTMDDVFLRVVGKEIP